jgi:hypothetical protein
MVKQLVLKKLEDKCFLDCPSNKKVRKSLISRAFFFWLCLWKSCVFAVIVLDYPSLTTCVVRKYVEIIGKIDDKKDSNNTKTMLQFSRLEDESAKFLKKGNAAITAVN